MNTSRNPEQTQTDLYTITEQIKEGIRSGKYTLQELQSQLVEKTKEAARTTDEYVHDNPWQMIAIAGGIGLLIGLMIQRR